MSPKHHATSTDPAAVATAVLSGCSAATGFPLAGLDPALTRVDYRYTDSSVAPEFHRSYDLSARADDVTIVVDSYGEILHDETASIDDATWQASCGRPPLSRSTRPVGRTTAMGSTSRNLQITGSDTDPILDVQVAVCG